MPKDHSLVPFFYITLTLLSVCVSSNQAIGAERPSEYAPSEFNNKLIHYTDGRSTLMNLSSPHDGKLQDATQSSTPTPTPKSPAPIKKAWNWKDYAGASIAGAARGIAGLPIEHPLDCVKTRMQSRLELNSGIVAAKDIFHQKGFRGFFDGVIPNGLRMVSKQLYRYPLMFYFPTLYSGALPPDFEKRNPAFKKALTGVSIAALETYFLCPLERVKVYLMTLKNYEQYKQHHIRQFFNENRQEIRHELFRGLNALFPKQIVSWVTFLVADHKIKALIHDLTKTPISEELSFPALMVAGTAVGAVNTAATLPFDCAKTQLQMHKYLQTTSLRQAMGTIYNQYGIMGLYRGWQVRMAQYVLHSIFTVTVLEKLEKR